MLVDNGDEHVCKLCAFPSSEPSSPKWKDEEKHDSVNYMKEPFVNDILEPEKIIGII